MQYQLKRLLEFMKNRKMVFLVLIALCCTVLLAPHLLRLAFHQNLPIGDTPYKDAVIAENIVSGWSHSSIWGHNPIESPARTGQAYSADSTDLVHSADSIDQAYLSLSREAKIIQPQHIVLAVFSYLLGIEFSLKLIPFLCGLLSFYLLYKLLKGYELDDEQLFLFMFMLILSPIFIYAFVVFNSFSLIVPLVLTALLLMNKDYFINKYSKYIRLIIPLCIFAILPFFGEAVMIVSLICLLLFSIFSSRRLFFIGAFLSGFSVGAFYLSWLYLKHGLPQKQAIIMTNIFQDNLSMFGAGLGFSLFFLLLALIGIISTWKTGKTKKQYYGIYLILVVLAVSSLFYIPLMKTPLNFLLAFFASVGFLRLLYMRWSLKQVANLTIITIVIGLVLTPVFFTANLVDSEPHKDMAAALLWLRENSEQGEVVFSDYRNGYWIGYFAERPVMMDMGFEYLPDAQNRYDDSRLLLITRDYDMAHEIIDKYSISYILIEQKMQFSMHDGNIAGLPFILENIETFKNVYSYKDIEIWKVSE